MKNTLLILCAVLLGYSTSYALSAGDFQKDDAFSSASMQQLDELETTVRSYDQTVSYAEIVNENPDLAPMNFAASEGGFSIEDMDWGAFAWGFCCCPVGFFVVAINSNKSSESKLSYWIGVGVSAVLSTISSGSYIYLY